MTELELINEILERLETDKELNVAQPSMGRGDVHHQDHLRDEKITYWIVRNEIKSSSMPRIDIHGRIIGYEKGYPLETSPESDNGKIQVISRNSLMGDRIIYGELGIYEDVIGNSQFKGEVLNRSHFEPHLVSWIDAERGEIISTDFRTRFSSLLKRKMEIEEIVNLNKEIEKETDYANKQKLIEKLISINQTRESELQRKRRYIINTSMLRDTQVLDSTQENIKRSQVLEEQLIISGGPGTGKTTSLIQRINFLISNTIKDYRPDLSEEIIKDLGKRDKSWIFFTPSQLLKHYLKNLMAKEMLNPDDERVSVWSSIRIKLFREFGLSNPDSGKPFRLTRNNDELLNPTGGQLVSLMKRFDSYFAERKRSYITLAHEAIDNFTQKDEKLQRLDHDLQGATRLENISEFFGFFKNLHSKHREYVEAICDDSNKKLNAQAVDYYLSIKKSDKDFQILKDILIKDSDQGSGEREEGDESEEEIVEITNEDFEKYAINFLRNLLRNKLLSMIDKNTKVNSKYSEITDLTNSHISGIDPSDLQRGFILSKYVRKLTRGIEHNILRDIPPYYKSFRKTELLLLDWLSQDGKDLLKSIIKDRNDKIHVNEMDFVLLIIFKTIHSLFRFDKRLYENSNDAYIEQFRNNSRFVIAIDEATDFSVLELSAMTYLSHPAFMSVSLSGDVMQRLQSSGIKSWTDYQKVFPSALLGELTVSYRQTEYLTNLAKDIYFHNTGEQLNLQTFYGQNEYDPQPLLFKGINKEEKFEWLAKRILDINKINGNRLPSIAVFVKDEDALKSTEAELNKFEFLSEIGIEIEKCPDGKVLGEASKVRIFSVSHIKGLEFEAVFFLDVDEYMADEEGLLDRYLYVGISRASLFLAVTVSKDLPDRMKYLERHFTVGGEWEK